jgi:hypothetical protein
MADSESVRLLAGRDPHDPWALEELLADSLAEANLDVPGDLARCRRSPWTR